MVILGAFFFDLKYGESSKHRILVEGGPLSVTDVADDAEIHNLFAGAMLFSAWKLSRAACADFSSDATIVDHDLLAESTSSCWATFPTWAPALKAIRTDSMARGRRAVRQSAQETAVAVIRPVHRPTSLASALGNMYDGVRSENSIYSNDYFETKCSYSVLMNKAHGLSKHGIIARIACMLLAMEEVGIEEGLRERLLQNFFNTADFMRNQPG